MSRRLKVSSAQLRLTRRESQAEGAADAVFQPEAVVLGYAIVC